MEDVSPERIWLDWLVDCRTFGLPVSEEQLPVFQRFYATLLETNSHTNLTRITELRDFVYKHLLDSLLCALFIPDNARLADVGSGAGFPVIPLLLARPDITAVAIESVGKKCAFMQKVRVEFGLESRFEVLSQRSEELGRVKGLRDGFDVVTARALAPLPTLLELCTPLLKPGGVFIAIKGASHVDELAQAKAAIHRLKLRHKVSHAYELPDKLRQTVLMLFEKTAPTPEAYPRRVGIPGKSPL